MRRPIWVGEVAPILNLPEDVIRCVAVRNPSYNDPDCSCFALQKFTIQFRSPTCSWRRDNLAFFARSHLVTKPCECIPSLFVNFFLEEFIERLQSRHSRLRGDVRLSFFLLFLGGHGSSSGMFLRFLPEIISTASRFSSCLNRVQAN